MVSIASGVREPYRGLCGTCGPVLFNHVGEVSEHLCEVIPKPRISSSSLHSAALCRQVFTANVKGDGH